MCENNPASCIITYQLAYFATVRRSSLSLWCFISVIGIRYIRPAQLRSRSRSRSLHVAHLPNLTPGKSRAALTRAVRRGAGERESHTSKAKAGRQAKKQKKRAGTKTSNSNSRPTLLLLHRSTRPSQVRGQGCSIRSVVVVRGKNLVARKPRGKQGTTAALLSVPCSHTHLSIRAQCVLKCIIAHSARESVRKSKEAQHDRCQGQGTSEREAQSVE